MWKPIYQPEPWPQFVKRKDIIGLPLMEQRKKFMEEQILFENYLSSINTVNTVSTAAAGAVGGPAPGGGGGGGNPNFPLDNTSIVTAKNLWFSDQAAAEAQYGLIGEWNTTDVTNLQFLFYDQTTFNEDISAWDVSNVQVMFLLFYGATSFNQDISSWDVSSATSMQSMFMNTPFNQDIGGWNVSNVTNMSNMFSNNTSFNQDISGWDVSNVTDTNAMFNGATSFNQDISSWDVSNVTKTKRMFKNASSFNQDLSTWDVTGLEFLSAFHNGAGEMFDNSALSTTNYDAILNSWSTQSVNPDIILGAAGIQYSAGAAATARGVLTGAPNNWTITDAGQA